MPSMLTDNDRLRVEHGLLPIDVDPARPVTQRDRDEWSPERARHVAALEAQGFKPMIHRTFLCYHK